MTRPLLGLAAAILLAGCAAPAPSSTPGLVAPAPSSTPDPVAAWPLPERLDPAHVLVKVGLSAGLAEPDRWNPVVAELFGDGTLIAWEDDRPFQLPTVGRTLDRVAMEQAWATIVASEVAQDGKLDVYGLHDDATTTITLSDGRRTTTMAIYGLGYQPDDGNAPFPASERAIRADATAAIATLTGLAGPEPWLPSELLLTWAASRPDTIGRGTRPWTPPIDLARDGVADGYDRCLRVEGEEAREVAAFLAALPSYWVVEQRNVAYSVHVRPIYPDEVGTVACSRG